MKQIIAISFVFLVLLMVFANTSVRAEEAEEIVIDIPEYTTFGVDVESGEDIFFDHSLWGHSIINIDYPETVYAGESFDVSYTVTPVVFWTWYTTHLWIENTPTIGGWSEYKSYYLDGNPENFVELTDEGEIESPALKSTYPHDVRLIEENYVLESPEGNLYWIPGQIEQFPGGYSIIADYESGVEIITLTDIVLTQDTKFNYFFKSVWGVSELSVSFTIDVLQPIDVDIDIKPGSDVNSINIDSNGNIPVAIFSTNDYDASSIDPSTVTLAGASIGFKGKSDNLQASVEDINDDGLLDLMVHISLDGLELQAGSAEAILRGMMFDGTPIVGSNPVNIVP
jgi:hypothetical protein